MDDLDIEHASNYKQLASWGGFRRHFKEEEGRDEDDETGAADTKKRSAAPSTAPSAADVAAWKQQLQEQLLAKRAEIVATQRKLESLSIEQQELEQLFQRAPV